MTESVFAILATGPSMNQDIADYVRGKCRSIAISNAYQLAPWAESLVSHDRAWWLFHKEAMDFAGEKYCKHQLHGTKVFASPFMPVGCNSGLMGMHLAKEKGATKILLLGFDMQGSHFFGPHPEGLKNTRSIRFKQHINQFHYWNGPEVINCTPDSALKKFPFQKIHDIL